MATIFGDLVQDRVGTFTNTDLIDHTLTDGARIVIDTIANREEISQPTFSRLDVYSTEKTDAGTGVAITGGRSVSAHKSDYGARRIPQGMIAQVASATSIHLATATDPVWYTVLTKGYVLPSGGKIRWVAYPTVLNSESAITAFPPEGYPTVVLYASVNCQMSIISTLVVTTMGNISFSAPANVTPPAAPSFTWTDATGTTIDLTTVSIDKILTYTPSVFGGSYTNLNTALGGVYTDPAFGGSYTNMETALGDEDVELAGGHGKKIQTQLDNYAKDIQNSWNVFQEKVNIANGEANKLNIQVQEYANDLQRSVAEFNKEAKQYDNELQEAITQAGIDAQRASTQAGLTQDLKLQNEINDYRQDVEEYQAKLGKYQTEVQDYAAQVGEEVQRIGAITGQYSLMSQSHFALLEQLRKEYTQSLGSL